MFKPISVLAFITVLTLPTLATEQDQIIKLDAKRNTQKNPVALYLSAGTYQVTPIGKQQGGNHSAWSVWGHTTCRQPRGCTRTVPTRFTGMHNNYYVLSEHLGTVKVQNEPLAEVTETPKNRMHSYYLADGTTRAYEVAQPMVYADAASALAGAQSSVFELKQNGRVKFALLDNSRISDNRGGMSLKITRLDTPQ